MRCARMDYSSNVSQCGTFEWRARAVPPSRKTARNCLVLLFASFLAAALTRQRFFYPLSFAGLQIERVTFYFLDYVLGLYLPLKPAKCVFQRFSLLKPYFSQRNYTPLLALTGQ